MKIMLVIPSLVKGGAERVASILSLHWAKYHEVKIVLFDVRAISYDYGGEIFDLNSVSGKNSFSIFYNPILRIIKINKLIIAENPKMIFSFMESANFPTIFATLFAGMNNRLTVSVRNNPNSFPKIHQYLMPLFYRIPGRVVPISKGVGGWLKEHNIKNSQLIHIPNPINIELIKNFLDSQKSSIRHFKSYSPYVLAVGRLNHQKGFDMLIEAFFKASLDGISLVILGEGSERELLQSIIDDYSLGSKVFLLGNHDEPYTAYQEAVCFVMSSRNEGWGNVIMEAMCCGCPVISFDCDYGPSEIIENGESGILVEKNNVRALSLAIRNLVENTELRKKLARNGLNRVKEFDVKTVGFSWLNKRV